MTPFNWATAVRGRKIDLDPAQLNTEQCQGSIYITGKQGPYSQMFTFTVIRKISIISENESHTTYYMHKDIKSELSPQSSSKDVASFPHVTDSIDHPRRPQQR